MKRIERLKRVVSEAREISEIRPVYDNREAGTSWSTLAKEKPDLVKSLPYNQLKDSLPAPILDAILRADWDLVVHDGVMFYDRVDYYVGFPKAIAQEYRLVGNYAHIILFNDKNDYTRIDYITVALIKDADNVGKPGDYKYNSDYKYNFYPKDGDKFKNIGYLFYRAEKEMNKVIDTGKNRYYGGHGWYDEPGVKLVRRGNYWGGENCKRYPVRSQRMSEDTGFIPMRILAAIGNSERWHLEWFNPKSGFADFTVNVDSGNGGDSSLRAEISVGFNKDFDVILIEANIKDADKGKHLYHATSLENEKIILQRAQTIIDSRLAGDVRGRKRSTKR